MYMESFVAHLQILRKSIAWPKNYNLSQIPVLCVARVYLGYLSRKSFRLEVVKVQAVSLSQLIRSEVMH